MTHRRGSCESKSFVSVGYRASDETARLILSQLAQERSKKRLGHLSFAMLALLTFAVLQSS